MERRCKDWFNSSPYQCILIFLIPLSWREKRRMHQETFQFTQAQLDQMKARIIGCNNTRVGSSNFLNSKGGYNAMMEMEIDRQSLTKVTPNSKTNKLKVTQNLAIDRKLVYSLRKRSIDFPCHLLHRIHPKQIIKPLKKLPKKIFKIDSFKVGKIIAQPSMKEVDGQRSPASGVVYLYEEKRITKKLVIVKQTTVKNLLKKKSSWSCESKKGIQECINEHFS